MRQVVLCLIRRTCCAVALCAVSVWTIPTGFCQEIRRAEPVRPVPPIEPFLPAKPIATPVPGVAEPGRAGRDEASPRIERAIPVDPRLDPRLAPREAPEMPVMPEPQAGAIRVAPSASGAGTAGLPPDRIQFDAANQLYKNENWTQAIAAYDILLRNFPGTPYRQGALYRTASAYRRLGQSAMARSYFAALLKEFVVGDFVGPAAYRLAEQYFEEKDYSEAFRLFRTAAGRLDSQELQLAARFFQARSAQEDGRLVEAGELFRQVAEAADPNPYREFALITLARFASEAGRKDEALGIYEDLAKKAGGSALRAEAASKAGILALELKDPDRAEALLNAALDSPDIGSFRDLAVAGRLRVLYETGRYGEVADMSADAEAIISEDLAPDALLLAANASRQAGRGDLAASLYARIAERFPQSAQAADARFQVLVGLYQRNDPGLSGAIEQFLASEPGEAHASQARLMQAESLFKEGLYEEAIPIYEALQGAALPERFRPEMVFKLGWCYARQQEFSKAIDALSGFLQEFPGHALTPSVLAQRGLCLRAAGSYGQALEDFSYLIENFPEAAERETAFAEKALLQGQMDDNAGMVSTFRQLLRELPSGAEAARANYWLGWAMFEEKDYREALNALQKARELDPERYTGRSTLRIVLAHYYLEDPEAVLKEVQSYKPRDSDPPLPMQVLRWLGVSLFERGNAHAGEQYLAVVAGDPVGAEDPQLWLTLARARGQLGKWDSALEAVEAGSKHAKGREEKARLLLEQGRAHMGLGNREAAEAAVAEVLKLAPEGPLNAEGLILQGDIEASQGDLIAAAKAYGRVALLFDDPAITPRALEKAYGSYRSLGQNEEAADVLNDLKTRFPEYKLRQAREE